MIDEATCKYIVEGLKNTQDVDMKNLQNATNKEDGMMTSYYLGESVILEEIIKDIEWLVIFKDLI